jgi:hypothetical protein
MAKKYIGADAYPFRQPGEQRVTVRIAVERSTVAESIRLRARSAPAGASSLP